MALTSQDLVNLFERRFRVAQGRVNSLVGELYSVRLERDELERILAAYAAEGVRPREGYIPPLDLPEVAQ